MFVDVDVAARVFANLLATAHPVQPTTFGDDRCDTVVYSPAFLDSDHRGQ